jgi:hypothetical protein
MSYHVHANYHWKFGEPTPEGLVGEIADCVKRHEPTNYVPSSFSTNCHADHLVFNIGMLIRVTDRHVTEELIDIFLPKGTPNREQWREIIVGVTQKLGFFFKE